MLTLRQFIIGSSAVAVVAIASIAAVISYDVFMAKPFMPVEFNAQEKAYIKEHRTITMGVLEDHPPIVFMDGTKPSGISEDYVKIIEDASGIKFKLTMQGKVPELIEAIKTCKVSVIPGFRANSERIEYMSFSQPYVNVGTSMLVMKNTTLSLTPKIGVANGYAAIEAVVNNQNYKLVKFPGNKEVIEALLRGDVEGAVMVLPAAHYHIAEEHAENLLEVRQIPWSHFFSMGVCKSDEVLVSIMNKVLSSVSQTTRRELESKWKIDTQYLQ